MNLDLGLSTLVPAAPAPPPPPSSQQAERASDEHDDALAKQDEFDRLMRQEMERKPVVVAPPVMPWMFLQTQAAEASADVSIQGTSAIMGGFRAPTNLWSTTVSFADARPTDSGPPPPAPATQLAHESPSPVRIMVEAGLPPIQPVAGEPSDPVHLVKLPQVVVGQVRHMVKQNQPLTQLNFTIMPPHVGPVQLQVALHQGVINVQLTALTLQAKQALESQVGSIHSILTAHNLTPGQVRVVTAVGGRNGAGAAGQKGDQAGFSFFNGGRKRPSGPDDVAVGVN